ncbi:hypothetical protein SAMN05661096_04138 [Marivirga sericea]|uniref:Uncharacterized protein n=1 Tax=Marivirga sericea TaxID=1028 RepID=A0A1X7LKG6_9BACT|nr:hypothetical protein [Marivirga sericea]SMG54378.1 hypothetical protein SAMN05661096_04138 [Marivirga sericea]
MKKIIFVIVSVLLILSLFFNFVFFYILRYDWDWEKDKLQDKTRILYYLTNDVRLDVINDKQLENMSASNGILNKVDSLKTASNDTLTIIQEELVAMSGGYLFNGNYVNPKAKTYVKRYFYEENFYRPYAYKEVDSLLSNYIANYERLTNLKSELNAIPVMLSGYKRNSVSDIFYDLTLSESMIAISLIQTKIEIDFNNYMHNMK